MKTFIQVVVTNLYWSETITSIIGYVRLLTVLKMFV